LANTPTRGKILLGQQPWIGKTFLSTIFEMNWQNGEYVPNADIKTPRTTNLLELTLRDVLNSDEQTAIIYRIIVSGYPYRKRQSAYLLQGIQLMVNQLHIRSC